jgi:probable F420-dependent oxidoreductase
METFMLIETLLPMGKVDPGLRAPDKPLDIRTISDQAKLVEECGLDGLFTEETKDDPFVVMALAAQATARLKVGTAVTIAFPRSPTVMALSAWTIQKLSKGRFTLGLGPQVRAHIQRRYGVEPHPAGPWMRDYVRAVRAVWDTWQNGTPLNYQGEFYKLDLMVPLFDAGPIEHPNIPIHIAAVNTVMSMVAGEIADGIRPHPVCTPTYIRDVMLPEVRKGAQKAGRSLETFKVSMKPLIATAPNEEELQSKIRDARARIAFYASTPAYLACFEHIGLGALAQEAKLLSRAQNWEELPKLISDDILEQFVVFGTYDGIGRKLLDRYGDVVTNCEFSIAVRSDEEKQIMQQLVRDLHAAGEARARANILGTAPAPA